MANVDKEKDMTKPSSTLIDPKSRMCAERPWEPPEQASSDDEAKAGGAPLSGTTVSSQTPQEPSAQDVDAP
jgi:hypothetical protein